MYALSHSWHRNAASSVRPQRQTQPFCTAGWPRTRAWSGYVACHDRTSPHAGERANTRAANDNRPSPDGRASPHKRRLQPVVTSLVTLRDRRHPPTSRVSIVRKNDARTDKRMVLDHNTVPDQHTVLDGHTIADPCATLEEDMVADVAVLPNASPLHHMSKRPNARTATDGIALANRQIVHKPVAIRWRFHCRGPIGAFVAVHAARDSVMTPARLGPRVRLDRQTQCAPPARPTAAMTPHA